MAGGTALFSNSSSRNQNKNLVEFKAGKMTMKGKMVHPDKRKGLLYIFQSEDSLMHFCWKERTTNVVEDVSKVTSYFLNIQSHQWYLYKPLVYWVEFISLYKYLF